MCLNPRRNNRVNLKTITRYGGGVDWLIGDAAGVCWYALHAVTPLSLVYKIDRY